MRPVIEVKKMFLDREKAKKFMDKKTARSFNRYGSLVRKIAQRSMRSKKGKSAVGQPPNAHGKRQLRKLLFYSYNDKTQILYIGSVILSSRKAPVPRLQEHGGTFTYMDAQAKMVHATYPERAFMKPAHEQSIDKLPGYYKH